MRYVFLVPAASAGGIQVSTSNYARELERRGKDVLVVLWLDVSLPYSAKERGLFEGLDTRRVTFDGLSKASHVARDLADRLDLRNGDRILGEALPCVGHLVQYERRNKDILHMERLPGDVEDFYASAVRLAATCDLYVAVSRRIARKLRERLRAAGAGDIPIAVCPAGIEVPSVPPEPPPHDPFRLCFVGRLSREKRIPDLVGVAERLARNGIHFEFSILGTGGEKALLERLIRERNLEERFHLLGNVPHAEVLALLPRHHAFVLTSAYEGFPNSLCEAMAYGVVPVTSRVSGAEDIIRDGENGFLVAVGDTEAMADRLGRLARDEATWKRLSGCAYETARRELDISVRVDAFVEAVEAAWEGREARRSRPRPPLKERSFLDRRMVPNVVTRLVRKVWRRLRGRPADAAPRRPRSQRRKAP